ncbi:hypothetical protein SSS_04932 [Sarcoptes scabiei]|nr:hypothetical protein SSS_04932 [Sarcoptes scabiei]
MPRRESNRRKHSLTKQFDCLETLDMRLKMLQLSFDKPIRRKLCCFFPGSILDETNRILRKIRCDNNQSQSNSYDDFMIEELFDQSTMAIEFFRENVEPLFSPMYKKDSSGDRIEEIAPKPSRSFSKCEDLSSSSRSLAIESSCSSKTTASNRLDILSERLIAIETKIDRILDELNVIKNSFYINRQNLSGTCSNEDRDVNYELPRKKPKLG